MTRALAQEHMRVMATIWCRWITGTLQSFCCLLSLAEVEPAGAGADAGAGPGAGAGDLALSSLGSQGRFGNGHWHIALRSATICIPEIPAVKRKRFLYILRSRFSRSSRARRLAAARKARSSQPCGLQRQTESNSRDSGTAPVSRSSALAALGFVTSSTSPAALSMVELGTLLLAPPLNQVVGLRLNLRAKTVSEEAFMVWFCGRRRWRRKWGELLILLEHFASAGSLTA